MRGAMASVPDFLKVLDPRELARSGSSWQGILSLGGFKRVTQFVPDHDASVELSLNFSFEWSSPNYQKLHFWILVV